jgi:hypothetical protein
MFNYTNNTKCSKDMKKSLKCWQYYHCLIDVRYRLSSFKLTYILVLKNTLGGLVS